MNLILTLPFLGTALGAAMVFLLRGKMSDLLRKLLLGFASGVMVAASVWSLLIPSLEMSAEAGGIFSFYSYLTPLSLTCILVRTSPKD